MIDPKDIDPETATFEDIKEVLESMLEKTREEKEDSERLLGEFNQYPRALVEEDIEQLNDIISRAEKIEEEIQTLLEYLPDEPDAARNQKIVELRRALTEINGDGSA